MNKQISKRPVFVVVLAAVLLGLGCSHSNDQSTGSSSDVLVVTDNSFKKEVLGADLPVLVDFWATWCGPCRMYGPVVDQVAKEYGGRLKVVRVDVDQNPDLSRTYQINAIPRSILFQKGTVLKNWIGYMGEDALKQELNQALPAPQPSAPSHS